MKIDRLLAILHHLVRYPRVRAQDLADKFEVSVRTIYRDLDALSMAGFPVVTQSGAGGGISVMEGYTLDRSVFSADELAKILIGLKGVATFSADAGTLGLIDKLENLHKIGQGAMQGGDQEIVLDLSPWNSSAYLNDKVPKLRTAIRSNLRVQFTYHAYRGSSFRTVEPVALVFKDSAWYLYAHCLKRDDFRLFKLSRVCDLLVTEETFVKKVFNMEKLGWDSYVEDRSVPPLVMLFKPELRYAVMDLFSVENMCDEPDGRIKVILHTAEMSWLYGPLLSFGDRAEVVSPPEAREAICERARQVLSLYSSKG